MYPYIMGEFKNRVPKTSQKRQKYVKNTLFKIAIIWYQIEN